MLGDGNDSRKTEKPGSLPGSLVLLILTQQLLRCRILWEIQFTRGADSNLEKPGKLHVKRVPVAASSEASERKGRRQRLVTSVPSEVKEIANGFSLGPLSETRTLVSMLTAYLRAGILSHHS